MKISDLTHDLFVSEMERVLSMGEEHEKILARFYGRACIEPVIPVVTGPYSFAASGHLWELWEYAAGRRESAPQEWKNIISILCDVLWKPLGGDYRVVPTEFWQEPLGFMCKAATARNKLEVGEDLIVDDMSILAGISRQAVQKALLQKGIQGYMADGRWYIKNGEAKRFLARRGGHGRV